MVIQSRGPAAGPSARVSRGEGSPTWPSLATSHSRTTRFSVTAAMDGLTPFRSLVQHRLDRVNRGLYRVADTADDPTRVR
jgi:hypothetical protein